MDFLPPPQPAARPHASVLSPTSAEPYPTSPQGPAASAASPGMQDGLLALFVLASFSFLFGKLDSFSCDTKEILMTMSVRHVFGLAGLFAVLVIFTRASPVLAPPALVAVTVGLYAIFVVICRCDPRFLAAVLVAVVVILYLEAERCWTVRPGAVADADATRASRLAWIRRAQTVLGVGIVVVAAAGCLVYIGQHSREYKGNKWSWTTFWLGVSTCKNNGSPCKKGACSVWHDMGDGARRVVGV